MKKITIDSITDELFEESNKKNFKTNWFQIWNTLFDHINEIKIYRKDYKILDYNIWFNESDKKYEQNHYYIKFETKYSNNVGTRKINLKIN